MDKSGDKSDDDSRRKSESDDFPHQVRDKLLQVQAAANPQTTPFRARSRSGASKTAAFKESDTETYNPGSSASTSSMLKPPERERGFTAPCSRVPSTDSVTSSPYPTITTHDVYPPPKPPRNTRSLASASPQSQGSATGSSLGSPYPTSRSSSARTLSDIPASILDSSSTRSSFDAGHPSSAQSSSDVGYLSARRSSDARPSSARTSLEVDHSSARASLDTRRVSSARTSSDARPSSSQSQQSLAPLPPSGKRSTRLDEKRGGLRSSRSLQKDDDRS